MRYACLRSVLLCAALLPIAAFAAPTTIADGTPIVLALPKAITSGGPKVGDKLPLVVRDTVYDDAGQILIQNGAAASGTITASSKAQRLLRSGALDFTVDYVTAVDGRKIVVRGMQRKSGKKVGIGARFAISLLVRPLLLIKGKNVTCPAGMQFPVYVDGAQRLVGASAADAPLPLRVSDFTSLCAEDDTAEYTFTLTNPNQHRGLLNAAVVATVLDSTGAAIGSNASFSPTDPAQVICALRPGETRTFVKRIKFDGGYARTDLDVAQPWTPWDETKNPEAEVPVLYSEWKGQRTISGMLRNDQPGPVKNVEVVVVVRAAGAVAAFGVARVEEVKPGTNKEFEVQIVGTAAAGAPYTIMASGRK